MKKKIETIAQENVVDFQNIKPAEVAKGSRPVSAFTSDRMRMRDELIKNQLITGKLSGHIKPYTNDAVKRESSMTAVGVKPKRKCFEDILREAEERVVK